MTTVKIRLCSLLLVCLVLAGCSLPMLDMPMQSSQKSEETKLFAQGLDQYIKTRNLTTLKRLEHHHTAGKTAVQVPGAAQRDMLVEAVGPVLGQDQHIKNA